MQNITFYASADGALGEFRDSLGAKKADAPVLVIGVEYCLKLRLFKNKEDYTPFPISQLEQVVSWQWAMDDDFDPASNYILTADHQNISVSEVTDTIYGDERTFTEVSIPIPDTKTVEVLEYLGTTESKNTLNGELCGYNSSGNIAFLLQLKGFTVRNRITSIGDPTSSLPLDYLTASQVRALIAAGLELQFSEDGENWNDTQTEDDEYIRMRPVGNGAWSSAVKLPSGKAGKDGEDGVSPHIDPETKHWMIGETDTEVSAEGRPGGKGDDGEDGKSAYELAVENGYEGTVEEWLADLKGADGNAITPDATGVPEERPLYGDRPTGFIFGTTVISDEWTDVYYYAKKSDALNDWCSPMVIREYGHNGRDGQNIALLPPVEFVRDRDQQGNPIDHDYLHFSVEDYPGVSIACVTIETEDGEYVLPYNSATGITRILKVGNDYRIYFGQYVPDWERGKVYLAQGGVALDAIADAPEDGNLYARCNGRWVRITGAAEEPEEPTTPTALFGVIADGETYAVSQVTAEMLSSMTSAELTSALTETLNVTPGSVSVILVPAGYAVTKDDGFGNRVPFDENNGTLGTGANGTTVTLGGTEYKAYGEFNLVTGNTIIYIQQEN